MWTWNISKKIPIIRTSPSSPHASEICGDNPSAIPLVVDFNLPNEARSLSDTRSFGKVLGEPPNTNQWFVHNWRFEDVSLSQMPKKGKMVVTMTYRGKGVDIINNSIRIKVAGDYGTGTFATEVNIKVICP